MKPTTPALDISDLPTVTFRNKSLMWWGTAGFMVIEGWTLVLAVIAYLYVRHNFETWPPPRIPNPSLLIPTLNVLLMLVSMVPARLAMRKAWALDKRGVTAWLFVSAAFGLAILVLRWFELWALNVRWDTNAYGSVAWLIVGLHSTLLLLDVGDTIGLGMLFATREMSMHYFSDVCDNSNYWFFTVLLWIPLYLLVHVGPYVF